MTNDQRQRLARIAERFGAGIDTAIAWGTRSRWAIGALVAVVAVATAAIRVAPQTVCATLFAIAAGTVGYASHKLFEYLSGEANVSGRARFIYFCVLLGGIPSLLALMPAGIAWSVFVVREEGTIASWLSLGLWLLAGLHVGLVLASPLLAMVTILSDGLRDLTVHDYELAPEPAGESGASLSS